jgi:excisionase family DNA binding protein
MSLVALYRTAPMDLKPEDDQRHIDDRRRSEGRRKYDRLPEAISVQFAAEILDVHHLTIRRWIKAGWIKAYRIGPQLIRIPRSEIARMRTLRITYQDNSQRPNYPKV